MIRSIFLIGVLFAWFWWFSWGSLVFVRYTNPTLEVPKVSRGTVVRAAMPGAAALVVLGFAQGADFLYEVGFVLAAIQFAVLLLGAPVLEGMAMWRGHTQSAVTHADAGAPPQVQLTAGERAVASAWSVAAIVLPFAGVALAAAGPGTGRTIGVALLASGLIAAAIPLSPVLRRRVAARAMTRDDVSRSGSRWVSDRKRSTSRARAPL